MIKRILIYYVVNFGHNITLTLTEIIKAFFKKLYYSKQFKKQDFFPIINKPKNATLALAAYEPLTRSNGNGNLEAHVPHTVLPSVSKADCVALKPNRL